MIWYLCTRDLSYVSFLYYRRLMVTMNLSSHRFNYFCYVKTIKIIDKCTISVTLEFSNFRMAHKSSNFLLKVGEGEFLPPCQIYVNYYM